MKGYEMQFREWAAKEGRTHGAVANRLGISRSHVSQLLALPPKRTPSAKIMCRILMIAEGEITADELIREYGAENAAGE